MRVVTGVVLAAAARKSADKAAAQARAAYKQAAEDFERLRKQPK